MPPRHLPLGLVAAELTECKNTQQLQQQLIQNVKGSQTGESSSNAGGQWGSNNLYSRVVLID